MQPAPEVSLALKPCLPWQRLCRALAVVAAATVLAWALASTWSPWRALAALMGLGLAWGAWRSARDGGPGGRLRWTQQHWLLEGGPRVARTEPGEVDVLADLGGALLLRFRPAAASARPRLLVLARRDHPGDWHALRCALYSSRPSTVPAPARPPTA